jgi:hypothetical protein
MLLYRTDMIDAGLPMPAASALMPWMKEEKGIIHPGRGAYLRCPVSTAVQFSLRDEGSTEYMYVRGR